MPQIYVTITDEQYVEYVKKKQEMNEKMKEFVKKELSQKK